MKTYLPTRAHQVALMIGIAAVAFASATFVGAPALHAQVPSLPMDTASAPLTLSAIHAAVDRGNPRVRAASARARALASRVGSATRPPDPELQLGLMNYMVPGFQADPLLGMRQVQVMQMVPLPGKLAAAADGARARAVAGDALVNDVRQDARARAAFAFFDRWEALEGARIARETRRLLEDVSGVAVARYGVGEGGQSEVLRVRVEVARMDEEVVREEAMAESALARLAGVLDVDARSVAAAPMLPSFPDSVPSQESLEEVALSGRPMLTAGSAEVIAAAADARLAARDRWPDLRVGAQLGSRSTATGTDRMGSLMLGASLPIWARARQLRMRDEATAMHEMAAADLAEMRAETRARIGEVHADLMASRRLSTLYRTTVLPQAEAAASAALSAYRTGDADFLSVLESRMTENRYRRELAALDAGQARAWTELEMLLGRSLLTTNAALSREQGR